MTGAAAKVGDYIAIEGVDGSGGSTQARLLVDRLNAEGQPALLVTQPSPGPIGVTVRQMLRAGNIDFDALQMAFVADRMDLTRRVVEPALAAGTTVVTDRCEVSTAIYMAARVPILQAGEEFRKAWRWNEPVRTLPNLVVLVAVDLEVAEHRRRERAAPVEVFDGDEIQRRLPNLYTLVGLLLNKAGRELCTVDGAATPERVHQDVWRHVTDYQARSSES